MRVRKPARKDPSRLLLRGLGPSTGMDLLKAYVENTLGLDQEGYELSFPPARDCVLVQLRQSLSQGESPPPPPSTRVSRLQLHSCSCF